MDTSIVPRNTIAEALEDLEALWAGYDTIWDTFGAAEWARPYGKDWTFADQPFHMADFDKEIVNDPIEAGPDLPSSERWTTDTMRELNDWNAREFAKRPADETPARARERWQAERDRQRMLLAKHGDTDLDTWPYYLHLLGGDGFTLRDGIIAAIVHNWGELSELRHRAGRLDIPLPPRATTTAVSFYVVFLSLVADRSAVKGSFTLGLTLTGPGGGAWSVRVTPDATEARIGGVDEADVAFTMTPDDFNMVMIRQATNPMKAMLTGRVKVKGLVKMPSMRKVFREPKPDEPFQAIG
jgi:putative sterol carrier protein